jgi:Leucine-rich repeat (LRR) protein
LVELKAQNNSLVSLPEDLCHCSQMTSLNIEGNRINDLTESLFSGFPNLTELDAGKNALTVLPNSLGGLSKLIRLDVHQNRA